jgi:hypothetical protein
MLHETINYSIPNQQKNKTLPQVGITGKGLCLIDLIPLSVNLKAAFCIFT